jgi:hypothetical protein
LLRPHLPAIGLAVLIVCNLIATLTLATVGTVTGLHAVYYATPDWQGPPALDLIDPELSRGLIEKRANRIHGPFSVEWTGWLIVPASQAYEVSTLSDDGSLLYLDDRLIVTNDGVHPPRRAGVRTWLDRGPHRLRLRYFDIGPTHALYVQWRPADSSPGMTPAAPETIPSYLFSTIEPGLIASILRARFPAYVRASLVSWYVAFLAILWFGARFGARRLWPAQRFDVGLRIVMGAALLLFVTGIWWGLPDLVGWAPDECSPTDVMVGVAQSFSHGWHSIYPPFYFAILAAWDLPFTVYSSLNLIDRAVPLDFSMIFLAHRVLSVCFALLIVAVVYAIARDIRGQRAGVCAALVVIAALPFSYYAKLANVDVPYVSLFALSLVFYLRLLRTSRPSDFYLFTLTGLLAVCIKDQAYGFYLLPALSMAGRSIWSALRRTTPPAGVPSWRVLLGMGAVASATFAIGQNLLFNLEGFREHLEVITVGGAHYRMFPATLAGHVEMLLAAIAELGRSMTWPSVLAAAAGVALVLRRGPRELRWLLLMIVSYYLACITVVMYHYDRFFLGIIVLLAIVAGVWIADWIDAARVSLRWLGARRAVLAAACVYGLARVVSLDALLIVDTRYSAERWLTANVPQGRSIAGTGLPQYLPRQSVVPWIGVTEDPVELDRYKPDYVIINLQYAERPMTGPRVAFYEDVLDGKAGYRRVAQFHTTLPFSPLNYESRFQGRVEDDFSNLSKISPPIEVYARTDLSTR